MRYFKVTVIRGHMGNGYTHGTLTFYYQAKNLLEAMDRAKRQGGVKHNKMPLSACECSRKEYEEGMKYSAYARGRCKGRAHEID